MPILSNMIRFNIITAVRKAVLPSLLVFLVVVVASPASANQQAPAGGGSILNILLLALIAYFLVRMFRRRSGGDSDRRDEDRDRRNVRPLDRHEAARQMWEHLTGEETPEKAQSTTPTGDSAGFDESEFLEGAKLFFSRFQQAEGRQDIDELRSFMSESVYSDAVAMIERDASLGHGEVMLLNAKLMEVQNEGGITRATVFYDAQIRRETSRDSSEHVRAVWEFSRDDNVEGGLWILESINKVDQ